MSQMPYITRSLSIFKLQSIPDYKRLDKGSTLMRFYRILVYGQHSVYDVVVHKAV